MFVFNTRNEANRYIQEDRLINAKVIMIPMVNKPPLYGVVPIEVKDAILVKDWEELKKLNLEDKLYKVEIKEYNGWIRNKFNNDLGVYLSTHTFYGSNCDESTLLFQLRGFMIEIDNWDKGSD